MVWMEKRRWIIVISFKPHYSIITRFISKWNNVNVFGNMKSGVSSLNSFVFQLDIYLISMKILGEMTE